MLFRSKGAYYAAKAINNVYNAIQKHWNSGSTNQNDANSIAKNVVTNNHEYKVFRRKRRAPKSKYQKRKFYARKRRQKAFRQRVRKALGKGPLCSFAETTVGKYTKTWLTGDNNSLLNQWAIGQDHPFGCWLGEQAFSGDTNAEDSRLTQIANQYVPNISTLNAQAGNQSEVNYLNRMHHVTYKRHVLTIKNETTSWATGTVGGVALPIDIWTFVAKRNVADADCKSPYSTWAYFQDNQYWPEDRASNPVFTGISQANWKKPGQVPMDCPQFGSFWKKLQRVRIRLQPGESQVFDMKCPKGAYFKKKYQDLYTVAGKTMYWLIVVNPDGEDFTMPNSPPTTDDAKLVSVTCKRITHARFPFRASLDGMPQHNYYFQQDIKTPVE